MKLRHLIAVSSLVFFAPLIHAWDVFPSAASPGEQVELFGQPVPSSEPMVIMQGPLGGAILDDLKVMPTGLRGTVGLAAGASTEFATDAQVWWGKKLELPAQTHAGSGFSYVTQEASWFVGEHTDLVSGGFLVSGTGNTGDSAGIGCDPGGGDPGGTDGGDPGGTGGTGGTDGGTVGGEAAVFGSFGPQGGSGVAVPALEACEGVMPSIRVHINIDGGTGNSTNGDGKPIWPRAFAMKVHVATVGPPTVDLPQVPDAADNLAQVLNMHLNDLGLKVLSDGARLSVVLLDGTKVDGFALIQVE